MTRAGGIGAQTPRPRLPGTIAAMAQEYALLSPEKAVLQYRLAGIGTRASAHLLDLTIVMASLAALALVVGIMATTPAYGPFIEPFIGAILAIVFALGPIFYFVLFEGLWNGQTIGKKAMGLRVRMVDGTPITLGAAFARNVVRFGDFFPAFYLVGLVAMFTNPRSQRLGDLIAGTVVLVERRGPPRFTPAPHAISTHPLEAYVGDLRGMTPEEYAALRRMCDRFPELSRNVQDKMLTEVWQPIARRRGVPEIPNVHPLYVAEAVVMKYGRDHGLL